MTGSAYDFCLLVTQRVHRDDTDLVATGADAEQLADDRAGVRRPAGRRGGRRRDATAPDRQLLRLLRRPALGDARDARGRPARRPHRRLPRRADHADPRQGHDEGPVARLRADLRPAGRGLPRPGARAAACGSSATPAASTRPASPTGCARSPRASASTRDRARRGRRPAAPALGLGESALTANAYLGGFGIAAALERGRRRRGHRPGHRRLARGRAGDRAPRLDADVVRRAGRRRRRRATSSSAAPRPPAATSPASATLLAATGTAARLPDRRDRRRRLQRDHQARRHRRRGHRRHRHRAAGLRDPVDPLPRPRRHRRTSTSIALDAGRPRPGRGHRRPRRGAAGRLKVCVNELGGFRNTVEFVLTGLDVDAKADWVREQLDAAPRPADVGHLVAGPRARRRRRHRGGRLRAAPLHRAGPARRPGRQARSPRPPSSSRWRRTRASR